MAEAYPNRELCLISKGLYRVVGHIIGSESRVRIRRQTNAIFESIVSCDPSRKGTFIISGSIGEGFEFKSSDYDIMCILENTIVLNSHSCHMSNITDIPAVLLMETGDVSPGFTLLKCLRFDYRKRILYNFLVLRGDDVFVNSRICRESILAGCTGTIHGPCGSSKSLGFEVDAVVTLRSPFWPEQAISFIYRSLRSGWPSRDVLRNICKDGCFLVPINSKQQTDREMIDLEWRISFSLAEKSLVCSMNHCQFLCYGLMKVFMNEVLKKIPETGELLCSYFMKTAVFWEISENKNHWLPWSFISKFWKIFRRVMNWVSIGYCPNFFIPQHNMFYGKIYGSQQRDLMMRLRTLYDEGYMCLLHCTSLYIPLTTLVHQPIPSNFFTTEEDDVPSIERLKLLGFFPCVFSNLPSGIINLMKLLCNTASLVPTSDVMASSVKLRMKYILQAMAVWVSMSDQSHMSNKLRYYYISAAQSILRRTKSFLGLDIMFHALCSYRNGDYFKTIQSVDLIKKRMLSQSSMYGSNLDMNIIMECRRQGMSYEGIITNFVISPFPHNEDVHISIGELLLESNAKDNGGGELTLPPLVFLNFLLVLTYTRLNEQYNRNIILSELQTLLYCDDEYHIRITCKAISWEILGICQQLCGDYHGAYQSYINALKDDYNVFIKATIVRIISLLLRYKLSTDTTRL